MAVSSNIMIHVRVQFPQATLEQYTYTICMSEHRVLLTRYNANRNFTWFLGKNPVCYNSLKSN